MKETRKCMISTSNKIEDIISYDVFEYQYEETDDSIYVIIDKQSPLDSAKKNLWDSKFILNISLLYSNKRRILSFKNSKEPVKKILFLIPVS